MDVLPDQADHHTYGWVMAVSLSKFQQINVCTVVWSSPNILAGCDNQPDCFVHSVAMFIEMYFLNICYLPAAMLVACKKFW